MRTVSLVILAAGSATRMGVPKLVLDLGGRPLVRWVADTACCLLSARNCRRNRRD